MRKRVRNYYWSCRDEKWEIDPSDNVTQRYIKHMKRIAHSQCKWPYLHKRR